MLTKRNLQIFPNKNRLKLLTNGIKGIIIFLMAVRKTVAYFVGKERDDFGGKSYGGILRKPLLSFGEEMHRRKAPLKPK